MSFVPDTPAIVGAGLLRPRVATGCRARRASPLLRDAGLREAPRELAQEMEREGRLRLHEREEVLARDRDATDGRRRADAGDAGPLVDQERELAEEVAGPELD